MDIQYRQAQKEDCPKMGRLCSVAGDGLLEFLLDGLAPGMTAAEICAQDIARDKFPFTFRNATVAEAGSKVKGMAFSYHSRFHGITDDMREAIPAPRLEALREMFLARVEDSLYLDTLAVDQDLRRQGVGRRLMDMTKDKALDMGLGSLSLLVSQENQAAIALYQRCGFQTVRPVPLDLPEDMGQGNGLFLMECKIAQ